MLPLRHERQGQRLQAQRNVSSQTIASYRDTFRLLLLFTQQELLRAPHQQSLEDWTAPLILRFLDHLEKKRGNTVRTRIFGRSSAQSMWW